MVAIEQNIDLFSQETQDSVDSIIKGSDEHLDLILSITKPLDSLTHKFIALNERLINEIDNYTLEELNDKIMPKLREVNKYCLMLIGAIRTSFLYKDVRQSLKNYSVQHDNFREILHDIQHFKIEKDHEFDNLLENLNSL